VHADQEWNMSSLKMNLKSSFLLSDKADKLAERMHHEKQEQKWQDCEDELRKMAIKFRRK